MGGPEIWLETADMLQDEKLARDVWKYLFQALVSKEPQKDGFCPVPYAQKDGKTWTEITWIKTNFTAQWCHNTILALEFIREKMPESFENIEELLQESVLENNYHKS